jgi:hypothetical protein
MSASDLMVPAVHRLVDSVGGLMIPGCGLVDSIGAGPVTKDQAVRCHNERQSLAIF